jgi:hypothetical protein
MDIHATSERKCAPRRARTTRRIAIATSFVFVAIIVVSSWMVLTPLLAVNTSEVLVNTKDATTQIREPFSLSVTYIPKDNIFQEGVDRAANMTRIGSKLRWNPTSRSYFTHPSIDVRIPYPKGWSLYVDLDEDGEVEANIFDSQRIPESDLPMQYSFRRMKHTSIAGEVMASRNVDVTAVRRSGITMRKLRTASEDDMFGPDVYWDSYLWICGDAICELSGWEGHPVLEAATMSLIPHE